MDGDRFDALTRSLATRLNRRQSLKAFAAGLLGGSAGARTLGEAGAQSGQVDVCYRTGNPRRPYHFLRLDPRGAARLKDRRNFVVCEDNEALDRETCTCHPQGAEPEPPSEPDDPGCVAVGEECRRNGECCSHWCWQGLCQCTGSGANCANERDGEVEVCYRTGHWFRPHVTFSVSPLGAARLKGRRGYVVCDEGELLDGDTCACEPELGGEEPGASCGGVGTPCQNNAGCCGNIFCSNSVCTCIGWGGVCDGDFNLDAQCCSNSCVNNVCACLGTNVACTNDRGCCSGSCVNSVCSCLPTGAACQADAECCSNGCQNGSCLCASIGTTCLADDDCCVDTCVDNVCTCRLPAEPCDTNAQCCSAACANGACTCIANGAVCNVNSECCSGQCANGICACAPTAAVCELDSDCCSGECANGLCACMPGQCPPGQVCHESTCCAPNCAAGTQCGDDGCGGICGTCGSGDVCCGPGGIGEVNSCAVETCPSDMSAFCTSTTCCFPPRCANSAGNCDCSCTVTTEGDVVCAEDSGNQQCTSSSGCPDGSACTFSCGFGNFCTPLCS